MVDDARSDCWPRMTPPTVPPAGPPVFDRDGKGTVEYIEVAPEESIAAKMSFPGEQPTWALTFEPLDSGTRLTMRAERHVNVPVVGRGIEAFDGPGARDDGRAVAHGSQGAA
jgi:hypothetical protein